MSFVAAAIGGSALIGAGVGLYAANKQSGAAKGAAETQAEAADRALELQRQLYLQTREDLAPYREAGPAALQTLQELAGQYSGGPPLSIDQGLPAPYSPEQFTGQIDLFRDPSYQFRLQEGQRAVERSAASRGQLQSGNTLRDLTRFGQGLASQEYGAAFQRGLLTNQQQAQLGQQGYQNQLQSNQLGYGRQVEQYGLGRERAIGDQRNQFNQYQALANLGGTAAGGQVQANQALAAGGGETLLGRGNALSAGQIAQGNAFAGGLQSLGTAGQSAINNYATLSALGLLGNTGAYNLTPQYGY